jgi:hypothetical protein
MRSRFSCKNLVALTCITVAACGDSSSPNRRLVALSFSSQSSAAPAIVADNSAAFDVTVSGGGNTVVITKAQLVLRDIKLKETTATCTDAAGVEDCATIHVGPALIDLPLTTDGVTSLSASVPEGTYRRVQLKIHKPSDDADDAAFKTANPAFANISIRVEGTFNGQAFVFTSALTENVELNFNPEIVIDADNQNITVQVDIASWFKNGSAVIDPRTANNGQPNENLVRNNIRASLRAIEDEDRNGR